MQRPIWNKIATFLIWLIAAMSAVYWGLKFSKGSSAPLTVSAAAPTTASAVDTQALVKGLGGGKAPLDPASSDSAPAAHAIQASRFVLTGVVVQKATSGQGVALIAVDGKPPRPFRVNTALAEGVILHSVSAGKAMLSISQDSSPSLSLELPRQTSAVAGTAIAARPAIPPPIIAGQPTANSSAISAQMNALAMQPANPMAAPAIPGQRPLRQPAIRQRESEKETARDQAAQ